MALLRHYLFKSTWTFGDMERGCMGNNAGENAGVVRLILSHIDALLTSNGRLGSSVKGDFGFLRNLCGVSSNGKIAGNLLSAGGFGKQVAYAFQFRSDGATFCISDRSLKV